MEELLLYRKLRDLTQEEFQEFIVFADSPFFNADNRVPGLLRLLQQAHPRFEESRAIAKNTLVKALGLKSEESLRQLRTRTVKLLPRFFVQKELEEQPNTARLLLLDALQNRKLDKDLRSELDDFEVNISADDRPFHAQFRLDGFRLRELLRHQEGIFIFERYIESGNRYFLLKKIKQGCQLLKFQQIYKKKESNNLFMELDFLLPLHEKMFLKNAVLSAWRRMFELLKNPDEPTGLQSVQDFIAASGAEIPKKEQKDLFNTANNLLIGRLTQGHFNTLPELDWFYQTLTGQYRFAAREDLLYEGGYIPHARFKNVVAVACNAGQIDWAKDFLEGNIDKVMPEFREDLRELCSGSIAFYEHDLKSAAEHLSRISTRGNDFYFFDLESLQMRIFFLENDFDLFETRSEAVRKKLKTSGLSQAHIENYDNYFHLLKELFHLKNHPGTTAAQWQAFRQKVEKTNPVNQKKWLLEHIKK